MLHKKRLFTPGPNMLPERVRLAMAQDMLHHRKPEFKQILAETLADVQGVFGTKELVIPLSSSGTGAMVAAVCSLFAEGEKVLVVEGGRFGERWLEICKTHKVQAVGHHVPWGEAVKPADVAAALDADPAIKGVLMQMSETSTAVLHPVKDIAAITRRRDVLLVVDGISGVSISPCPMDEWSVDCLMTGSQKGLMLPPGLSLIALSARAWRKAEALGSRNYYFDLLGERDSLAKHQMKYTAPVSLIIGLHESMKMFKEFGLENIYKKQWAMTMLVREGVRAMGLELLAKEHFAWGVTSVLLPDGVTSSALLAHAAEKYGVIMASGQGPQKERVVRIGHMSWTDAFDLCGCLYAFVESFRACGGFIGSKNYLEQALAAYENALATYGA